MRFCVHARTDVICWHCMLTCAPHICSCTLQDDGPQQRDRPGSGEPNKKRVRFADEEVIARGFTIGVMSDSHAALHKVCAACPSAAQSYSWSVRPRATSAEREAPMHACPGRILMHRRYHLLTCGCYSFCRSITLRRGHSQGGASGARAPELSRKQNPAFARPTLLYSNEYENMTYALRL